MFDVDGTLITFEDKPRYDIIALFKHFESLGCTMIIASGGGFDYARHWAEKLGLEARIWDKHELVKTGFEIDITFDDEIFSYGKVNIRV
jgi:hydroxymethylpyrimidine pyrophosphatase-like HAD family hydrolase